MSDRTAIIENAIATCPTGDGDLIAYVNRVLVESGEHQLNCCERRDVFEHHGAACPMKCT